MCSAPTMGGGGVEFFTQDDGMNMNIPSVLAKDQIPCNKNYESCVYSAQGALMCNLKKNGDKVKESFVPGMVIGGLPNMPQITNMPN